MGGGLGKHRHPGTKKTTMSTQAKTLPNMAAAGCLALAGLVRNRNAFRSGGWKSAEPLVSSCCIHARVSRRHHSILVAPACGAGAMN